MPTSGTKTTARTSTAKAAASKATATRTSTAAKASASNAPTTKTTASKVSASKSSTGKASPSKGSTARKSSSSTRKRSGGAQTTTDHAAIQRWVEDRGGFPATVKQTRKKGDPGLLRIDFPGYSGEDTLQRIDWDEWFKGFEENKLAFLYEDEPDNRFSKLISRTAS